MCGIVGYIGNRQAAPVLMEGLNRLSYRGYDSAGIAVVTPGGHIEIRKTQGKLDNLIGLLKNNMPSGTAGIGHTRWATHGEPSRLNAHPHTDVMGGIAVVHNGIIENHEALRKYLEKTGAVFVSQTDTEVAAHLLHHLYDGDMCRTLRQAMGMLEGSYALGVLCSAEPDRLFCMKNDSPLVVGFHNGEGLIASDIPALLASTRDVIFLQDKEIAVLDQRGVHVYDAYGQSRPQAFFHVDWELNAAEKGGFSHYMLKEIHEQPQALRRTFAPRSQTGRYDWLPVSRQEALSMKRLTIVACGTALHAGLLGKYFIEKFVRIPVDVEIASEYRYRDPVTGENEWVMAISQSGETADTLAAVREARKKGVGIMALCNAVGSSIAREAGEDRTLYTYAGPEISVASTKAYITQAETLLMMAVGLGEIRGILKAPEAAGLFEELERLPQLAQKTLETQQQIQRIASSYCQAKHIFFVGRGIDYALAVEASLKLKEVSYLFSEAYAAGELKHGPIALIQPGRLVVACATQKQLLPKTLNNLQEAAARGAKVMMICPESFVEEVGSHADEMIAIPDANSMMTPLLAMIPLQLFAYWMAVERGCDVDKPRNLAKSVTVE